MKENFNNASMSSLQLISTNSIRHQVDAAQWEVIKSTLGVLPLPVGWVRAYAERSLTIRSRTGAITIKVTLDKQLFVDRRLKNKGYRSDTLKCETMEEACTLATIIVQEAVPATPAPTLQ